MGWEEKGKGEDRGMGRKERIGWEGREEKGCKGTIASS